MSLNLQIHELVYLFAAFHGVFLASLILLKRYTQENVFLFLLILLFSFYLVENVIYSSGYITEVPHLFFTTLPVIFLIGPLFFLYVRSSLKSAALRWTDFIHLIPFLFEVIILIPFYALDAETKVRIYEINQQPSEEGFRFSIYFVGYLVYLGSTCFYFFKSLMLIKAIPWNQVKARVQRKFKALAFVSSGFFVYVIISLIWSSLGWIGLDVNVIAFHSNLIGLTLLIHAIGYVAFSHPALLESIEKSSEYQFSSLSSEKKKQLSEKLLAIMRAEKLYLNSSISAGDLSGRLEVSNHELSQLLNVELNTNFYDLVNQLRVKHAQELFISKKYTDAKILHVALDSGFSNKSSFLRNFKKVTGLTPSAYKKLYKKEVPIN